MNHQAAFTQFFSELEDPRQTTKIAYPFFDVCIFPRMAIAQ